MACPHFATGRHEADGVAAPDAVQHRDVVHRHHAERCGDTGRLQKFGDQIAD